MENDNIITLNDENGTETKLQFLDLIEYQNEEYVVLLPLEEIESESAEVLILQIEDINSETESYISVEDENTLYAVFGLFKDKFKEDFNFVDWFYII